MLERRNGLLVRKNIISKKNYKQTYVSLLLQLSKLEIPLNFSNVKKISKLKISISLFHPFSTWN